MKLYLRGELVKVHPRKAPGQRSTDLADYPKGTEIYATRDVERLGAWRPSTGRPSGARPQGCSTRRCPGPGCARSTGCSAW